MATITTAIRVQDAMTPAFQSMNNALNIVLNSFEDLQNSTHKAIDIASIQTARNELANANATIQQVENNVRNVNNESSKMPQKFAEANGSANNLLQTLMGFSVIQRGINMIANQIGSAISRIDTLNNYPKVMANLGISSEQANASMQMLSDGLKRLPTTLNDAVGSVQRFTSANGNVGASTKMFLALNNAILAGGAEMSTQQSALEQLSQSYAKGKPDMMEWCSAMSAMPAQLGQVATAMNFKSADALGEALRNGKVSMNEFMNTLVELNEKGANGFPSLAEQAKNATGGIQTSIENMKTAITKGITDMITSINNSLEKADFGTVQDIISNIGSFIEEVLGKIGNFIGGVITLLSPIFNIIQQIGVFISDNWSIIAPIVTGIAIALGLYNTALGMHAIAVGVSTALEWLHNIATYAQATALLSKVNATLLATSSEYALAVATAQATVAQGGFNTALLACPIVWIILLIIAFIVVIYAVVAAINKWKGTTISATGIICSMIALAGAIIYNTFVGVVNGICQIIDTIANIIISIVEWILNVCCGGFDNFGDAVANLIGNIISWFLNLGKVVTKIIDAIFGTDWTSGLNSLQDKVVQWGKNNNAITLDRWDHSLERINYQDAVNAGYKFGQGIDESVENMFNPKDIKIPNDYNPNDYKLNDIVGNTNNISGNTGKISDTLDATEEDLKYLRDIAERETINRFTTAQISVEMNNNNNINGEMDIDGIVDSLGQKLEERLEIVAEGVYI